MALLSVCRFYSVTFIGIGPFPLRRFSLNSSPEMNKFKYAAREGKMLNKFLGSQSKKKRKLYFEDAPSDRKFNFDGQYNSSKENSRRISVMNTLFMKSISDLLATGSMVEDVLGKGLQISGVKMSKNFNYLNVYWATNNEENAAALEAVLPQLGFTLRHELSQLRVIGIVPRIVFVKDKNYHNVLKVEHLLSLADYGEDHVPLPLYSEFKNSPADECFNNAIDGENDSSNDKNEEEKTLSVEAMPAMRQDIFNLNHEQIMNKIVKSVQKSRAMHRFQPQLAIDSDGTINNEQQTSSDIITKQERENALSKFILDRKLLSEKQKRNKSDSQILETTLNDDYQYEDSLTEDYIGEDYLEEDNKY